MKTLLAILSALPQLLELINSVLIYARSQQDQGVGYDKAVADGVKKAHEGLTAAIAAQNEAADRHAADPTDDAFDQRFRRD